MQFVNQDETFQRPNDTQPEVRPTTAKLLPPAISPLLLPDKATAERPLALWQALDLLLEASALIQDHDPELAGLTMLSTIAVAERVGLPDKALGFMWQSVCAAAKRHRHRAPRRHASTKHRV